MRKLCLSLTLVLATLSPAFAQLNVEVRLEQDQFLAGEQIVAAVRITNRSGQTIHLGADEDWLSITVEGVDGKLLPRFSDPPVLGEFELETSKVGTKRVNLSPYFPLTQPGRYTVTATVKVKSWGAERSSQPKSFNIIQGSSLWEQEFGVPKKPGDTNAAPEIRRYSLHKAAYYKGQLRLYFRLTDVAGSRIYRVHPIGIFLSFSRPEVQIDQESNLHVLYLNAPHSFSYTVFSPDGELLIRQTHDFTETKPTLKFGTDSKVIVSGGVRRVTSSDVPPPPKEEETHAKTSTNAVPVSEEAKSPQS
jgi:hypothetical protein